MLAQNGIMRNSLKFIFFLLSGIVGIMLIYVIAKDTFTDKNTVFQEAVGYYDNRKYEAADQLLQSEANKGNKEAYPYLGHTKLILGRPKEAEKYLLLSLENLPKDDVETKKTVVMNLGSVYLNLHDYSKAKLFLTQAAALGDNYADELLIKYNLK